MHKKGVYSLNMMTFVHVISGNQDIEWKSLLQSHYSLLKNKENYEVKEGWLYREENNSDNPYGCYPI